MYPPITANSNTFVDAVGVVADNVVQLIRHTTRLRDIANGAFSVELGRNNVVHHPTSVADLKAAGLDTPNGSRTNDGDPLLLSNVEDLSGPPLRNTLGDDGNRLDLRELHELHGRAVHAAGGCEVHNSVHIAVLGHCLFDALVDREQGFARPPVPVCT